MAAWRGSTRRKPCPARPPSNCAAIAGSALAGAGTIIAVDIDDTKLARAASLGATHAVNSADQDPVEAIRELTGGFGADVVIDAVGVPQTWKQAFYARDLAGTVVLVGVPRPDMTVPDIPLLDVFGRGGSLKSSWYGDCLPSRDFQMAVPFSSVTTATCVDESVSA